MLTYWQRLIGHLPALLLLGVLSVAALMVWTAHDDLSKVPRGLTRFLLVPYLFPSPGDPTSTDASQLSQALPADNSGDDNSDANLDVTGQLDVAQPTISGFLSPHVFLGLLSSTLVIPGSVPILPGDPPPRSTHFLHV